LPDGIAMDAQGCLWVALYTAGVVRRYSPAGEWIGTITLPVKGVTSCGFGGPGLRDLYITTGTHLPEWAGDSPSQHAGALFRCRPGVAGMPVHPFGG
jgi:sugar lactone lactonase YvrE